MEFSNTSHVVKTLTKANVKRNVYKTKLFSLALEGLILSLRYTDALGLSQNLQNEGRRQAKFYAEFIKNIFGSL